jgi:hypothetical protein
MRQLGKLLAWILRHEPHAIGLEPDRAGWVEIDALLQELSEHGHACSRAQLERCVATDAKGRFSISPDGTRIRAAQGHSILIDLGLAPMQPPDELFHGTPERFVGSILEAGLFEASATMCTTASIRPRRSRSAAGAARPWSCGWTRRACIATASMAASPRWPGGPQTVDRCSPCTVGSTTPPGPCPSASIAAC